MIKVYNGRLYLGHIIERGTKRCEVYSDCGQALGVAPTPRKAANAINEAARGTRHEVAA